MEVPKIEEMPLLMENEAVRAHKPAHRPCIYEPAVDCAAPHCKLHICRDCPRMLPTVEISPMLSIFNYIRSFTIAFVNIMGNGVRGGNSGGGGAAGAGGAGGGGR